MKLISMTDFVLEQYAKKTIGYDEFCTYVVNYANFLKQPLELWMFVACDENGNVLDDDDFDGYNQIEIESYKQAKERCLFEIDCDFKFETTIRFYSIDFLKGDINRVIMYKDSKEEYQTLEQLCNHEYLKLTPTAQKQIGCDH